MTTQMETEKTNEVNVDVVVDSFLKNAKYITWKHKEDIGLSANRYNTLDSLSSVSEQLTEQMSKLNEIELYNALLKSKRFNAHIELICKTLSKDLIAEASRRIAQVERQRKVQEQARIAAEKTAEASEEGKRKLAAQKAALNKLLTKQQKVALKKMFGSVVDPTGLFSDKRRLTDNGSSNSSESTTQEDQGG